MKTLIQVMVVLCLFSGCGQTGNNPRITSSQEEPISNSNVIDPAFQFLYDSFITDSIILGHPLNVDQAISIKFATLQIKNDLGVSVGLCSNISRGHSSITFDKDYWNKVDDKVRLMLVYHELGHCVLAKGHTDLGNKMSIMNPVVNNPYSYLYGPLGSDNKQSMIRDLFN